MADCMSPKCCDGCFQALANVSYRVPDGKVCLNNLGELAVTKFAVEPVWTSASSSNDTTTLIMDARSGTSPVWRRDSESVSTYISNHRRQGLISCR